MEKKETGYKITKNRLKTEKKKEQETTKQLERKCESDIK